MLGAVCIWKTIFKENKLLNRLGTRECHEVNTGAGHIAASKPRMFQEVSMIQEVSK